MKKPPDSLKDGIGTALDNCSWDYAAPKPQRRFFLNPMSAFFVDFPWEGRDPKRGQDAENHMSTFPESNSDPNIPD